MKKACLALLLIVLAGLTACTVKQESVAPGTGGPSISDSGPEGSGNTSQEPEKLPANGWRITSLIRSWPLGSPVRWLSGRTERYMEKAQVRMNPMTWATGPIL